MMEATNIFEYIAAVNELLLKTYTNGRALGLAQLTYNANLKKPTNKIQNPKNFRESIELTFDNRYPISWFWRLEYVRNLESEYNYGNVPFFFRAEHHVFLIVFGHGQRSETLFPSFSFAATSIGTTVVDSVDTNHAVVEASEFPGYATATESFVFRIRLKSTFIVTNEKNDCCDYTSIPDTYTIGGPYSGDDQRRADQAIVPANDARSFELSIDSVGYGSVTQIIGP